MGTVLLPITEATYALITYGARLAGVSEDEFLRLAVMSYQPVPATDLPDDPWTPVPVHGTYLSQRTNGEFVRATTRLTVTSGALSGTTYPNPTAASRAVVHAINPARRSGHTDGWRFWRISSTGRPLADLRPHRRARPTNNTS
ncbi:MAG TPA: hypothetical protein VGX28_01605 [Frankiaceae bacterium]|nr:hypothetical protein [Frankiaceae bacterium]